MYVRSKRSMHLLHLWGIAAEHAICVSQNSHWLQGCFWALWCESVPMLLACQEVMAEKSAQKVSSPCTVCYVPEPGEDHADAASHWAEP